MVIKGGSDGGRRSSSIMKRLETMRVGIVAQRRMLDGRWQQDSWRPLAVVPGGGPDDWRLLWQEGGLARLHIGNLSLELHYRQSVEYRYNLESAAPMVFLALRRMPGEPGVMPWFATVSAHEAEAYLDSGDDIVGGVPLPPAIAAWMQAFIEQHPVIAPFRKRRARRAEAGDGEPGAMQHRGGN